MSLDESGMDVIYFASSRPKVRLGGSKSANEWQYLTRLLTRRSVPHLRRRSGLTEAEEKRKGVLKWLLYL